MAFFSKRVHQASDNTAGLSKKAKARKAKTLKETAQMEKAIASKIKKSNRDGNREN